MATSDDSEELAELPQRNPAWRTETVLAIARGILMEDAFDRYPILADAIEEAGCDDYELLAMLRADVDERQGELLDWVLQDDPGIDALLMERHEQFQRKRQQQAQAILEDESKRKLNRFNPTLGFVAVVSIFCLCQINN